MLKLFSQIYSEKSHHISKNIDKNCLHQRTYKTFPFLYESSKGFFVMNYRFTLFRFHRTLTPIRNNLQHASVNAIWKSLRTFADSSRIRKNLSKCERSIMYFTLGHLSKRYKTFAIFFVENFFYIVCFFSQLFSTI